MRWFALSSAVFFGIIAMTAWWFSRDQHSNWSPITASVLGVSLWPWAIVVLTGAFVQSLAPRRIFAHRPRRRNAAMALGVCLSVFACVCTLPALTVFDLLWPQKQAWNIEPGTAAEWINDHRQTLLWCVVALVSAASTLLALIVLTRRVRPGCCTSCGYNLSTITPAAKGLCPECGHDQFDLGDKPLSIAPRPMSPSPINS